MGDSGGDGGGGNCTRVDLGEGLTICLRSKAVGKHSIPVLKWHGRPARESRARCACHIQTAPLPSPESRQEVSYSSVRNPVRLWQRAHSLKLALSPKARCPSWQAMWQAMQFCARRFARCCTGAMQLTCFLAAIHVLAHRDNGRRSNAHAGRGPRDSSYGHHKLAILASNLLRAEE